MRLGDLALVTGGAGFIGSNLALELLARGARVRVFDDLSTGRRSNLDAVSGEVELVEGDVRDPSGLEAAMRGVTTVFHEAAIPSVFRSVGDPRSSHDANATGTLNVLIAARDAEVERVVYASSSSVYGDADVLPVHEELPTRPLSPYGVSKLAGERYLGAFAATYGMAAVSLRYFNVFGPRQNPDAEYAAVVPRFIARTMDEEPVRIFGDGEQSRDFTFVGDVVGANLAAAEAPEEAWGRAFNVAYGDRHSVNELLSTIQELVPGEHPEPEREPPRPGDIRDSQADISLARDVLGYEPRSSFAEGLSKTVAWFAKLREDDRA
ncbi:MAG: NAD-dependent epimerase/dehydratase family protein [Actinomycetota bacterium]|nr:NAD-dependent epimerase/dehydratase family protein [Actinomycetota bacterium]